MSSVVKSGNLVHDNACLAALGTLQAGLVGATTQSAINTLYIAFHRAIVASCKANNNGSGAGPSMDALRNLGTGGL